MDVILLNGETWLICGGRNFADQDMFDNVMHDLVQRYGCPIAIVHGAAKGADRMGGDWARRMAITEYKAPAQWAKYGKAAGHIRNQEMLDNYKPKRVIAFPGNKGTADMVAKARRFGCELIEVKNG